MTLNSKGIPKLFRLLCPVFWSSLFTAFNTQSIKDTPYNMVPYTWQILYTTSANKNYRMFLKIVSNARYISCNFHPSGQPDPCNFTQSRIRLFGCRSIYARTHSPLLRSSLQSWRISFLFNSLKKVHAIIFLYFLLFIKFVIRASLSIDYISRQSS